MPNETQETLVAGLAVPPRLSGEKDPLGILVIEDDGDDRELILSAIRSGMRLPHQVKDVGCLGEAFEVMAEEHVDVLLLDLGLPDAAGVESVEELHAKRQDAAIIVISDSDQDDLIESCFDAGAHDFIQKSDLNAKLLARVIGYALYRIRDRQLREITKNLEQYRHLTSAGAATPVAGRMTGGGSLSERMPALFQEILQEYRDIAKAYMRYLAILKDKPTHAMERVITRIGDQGGGPRDLMDVHVEVIDEALRRTDGDLSRTMTSESRLLALEVMGMLVNYYRVGTRRR